MKKMLLAIWGLVGAAAFGADTVINLNGGSQSGSFNGKGPIAGSYTIHGPGTFTSTGRVYPNNTAYLVTFDQGAVVWLTTHNAATDGLIVSGNQGCQVKLGNCTVGSTLAVDTCLARYVTLVLTDEEVGASITTVNNAGTKITMQTNPSQRAIVNGTGKLNLIGGGTFTFNPNTTFNYTGATTVKDGTSVQVLTAVAGSDFYVKEAGRLSISSAGTVKSITVQDGGILDAGSAELSEYAMKTKFEAGSQLAIGWTSGDFPPLVCFDDAEWPEEGVVVIAPSFATEPADSIYPIVTGVGDRTARNFALSVSRCGSKYLGIKVDVGILSLVVSSTPLPVDNVWTGGASGPWDGLNWDHGQLFSTGGNAVFRTAGAQVTLPSTGVEANDLVFEASTTLTGNGRLTMNGAVSVAADQTARIESPTAFSTLNKDGAGRLELTTIPETFAVHHAQGTLVMNGVADQIYSLTLPNGQIGANLIINGPGQFRTSRLYPYPNTSQWTFDGGAELFVTTGNASVNGLVVGQNPVVNFGECSLASGYGDQREVALGRSVYMNLTDAETGFTLRTANLAGGPITFYWHATTDEWNNDFETRGPGRLNLEGPGTFIFNGNPSSPGVVKLGHTGGTVFKSGVSVKFAAPVQTGAVTVEPNVALEFEMVNGTANTAALKASAITWPESGTIPLTVRGSTALADGEYVLATGAGAIPMSRFATDIFILGKTLTLENRDGSLVLTVVTTVYDVQTWKGGDGNWSDADGWNGGHAWIPYGLAIFPVDTTGTVNLGADVTASELTFLGNYTLAGTGRLSNASVPGVVCAEGNTTINVPYETQSGLFVKTGAGTLTFADASWTPGITPEIRTGRVAFTSPAAFATSTGLTMYDGTALDLGGGTLSWTNNLAISGNIRWENGTFTKMGGSEFRPAVAGTHLTLAKGGSITTQPGQRVFFDRGTALTMESDAGTITCTAFGAGIDYATENTVTIHGGAIHARGDYFRIVANEKNSVVTFVMDGGELSDISQFRVGMAWTGTGISSGSADVTIGGTASITLTDGFYTGNANTGTKTASAQVALHFDGGTITTPNGLVAYTCEGENTISFNGTVFRATKAHDNFFNIWGEEDRTVTIDAGGLIIDSGANAVAAQLPFPGEGAIVKRGTGTLTLKGTTAATGGLRVEAGRLAFGEAAYTASGNVSVAAGAVLAAGLSTVAVPGTLTLADGAVIGIAVDGLAAGSVRAQTVAQAGAVTFEVTPSNVPAQGVYTLVDDLTGWDATQFQLAVQDAVEGFAIEVRGNKLLLVRGNSGAWKGGADAWSAADGWGGAAWTDGAVALFDAAAGNTVTVDGDYALGGFAFLANTTVAAGTGGTLTLADGSLNVPAGVEATVTAPLAVATLVKRGEGSFTLGGTQPAASFESVRVEAGTFGFAGTQQGGDLTVGVGAKAAFAAGAEVSFQTASIVPGEALVAPESGTAKVNLGTVQIGTSQPEIPAFVVPQGLDVTVDYLQSHYLQDTHAMTWINNFGVRELVIDGQLTLVNGIVLGFTGYDYLEYYVNGTGTLRLPGILARTSAKQVYGPLRVVLTGESVTPTGVCGYAGATVGSFAFDGTTLAGAGVDWYWHMNSDGISGITIREGGLTIDTTDADDGTTARRLVFGDERDVAVDGPGDLTIVGNGTFGMGYRVTLANEGCVRVKGTSTLEYSGYPMTPQVRLEDPGARFYVTSWETPTQRFQGRATVCTGAIIEFSTIATATFPSLELAAGAILRADIGDTGVARFDLRGCNVTYPAEGQVNFEVNVANDLPAGRYTVLNYDTLDHDKLNPSIVGSTTLTGHFEFDDEKHRMQLVVEGSSVEPAQNLWAGDAADGAWSKALNWRYSASPVEGLGLVFEGASGLTNHNDTGVSAFPSLTFQNSTSAVCGAFDVDLALAEGSVGPNPVTSSAAAMQVVRGYVMTANVRKKDSGDVMFVDPVLDGYFVQDAGSPVTFYASAGKTVALNSNGGAASAGPVHYTGPGTFRHNTRFYPNAAAYPVTVDGGATVWLTTHNGAGNGLIVAGGTDRKVNLGDCSVGSLFPDTTVLLQRAVSIVFTDTAKGTTLLTDNVDGTPITLTTADVGIYSGAGRVNIGGHGTFRFNANATFSYTGPTFVNAGATAEVYKALTTTAFTVGGILNVCTGGGANAVTVANGGTLKTTGGTVGSVTAQTGSTIVLDCEAGLPIPFMFGNGLNVAPAAADSVVLACADTALPNGSDLMLTAGAGLADGDEKKFKLEFTGKQRSLRRFVRDGELWIHVNTYSVIYLR